MPRKEPEAKRKVKALSSYERETIIRWSEGEAEAVLTTCSASVIRRMVKRGFTAVNAKPGQEYQAFVFPKNSIRLPQKSRKLTPEEIIKRKRRGEALAAKAAAKAKHSPKILLDPEDPEAARLAEEEEW